MHYKCLLFTKEFATEEKIAEILKPYDENDFYNEDGEETKEHPVFMWDWYQIGGRYNGSLKLKLSYDENESRYEWRYMARVDRNGRLLWSYLLSKMKEFSKGSFMYREDDYFSSMGARDGFVYVDGAYVSDLLNFDKVEAYCFIDKDGNAIASQTWTGETWLDNADYDAQLEKVKSESADCFVTVIDLHD